MTVQWFCQELVARAQAPGVSLALRRQSRLNRRLEVIGGDAALEAGDHCAVLAHQELLKVPLHITSGVHLIEGGVGLGGAALGVHFLEQFEVGAVGGGTETLDLIQGAGLLGAKVVAGEAQNG